MILKFNILKLKLKLLLLRTTGRINQNIPTVELNQQGHNLKDILIIFPQGEAESRVAMHTFENLLEKQSDCTYYFIINNYKEVSHKFFHNTISIDFNKNITNEISSSDKTYLLNKNFDVIVDLNTTFNYNCSKLVNIITSRFKIGFKSKFSDLFYNIQLDASSTNIIENIYKKIYSMVLPI